MGISLPVLGVPGVLGGGSAAQQTFYDYLTALGMTLIVRYDETSGPAINYGTDGNTGAVVSATQGQAGLATAPGAYLFDGADDYLLFANGDIAGTVALTTQRWLFLINASSLGENDNGAFFTYGSGALQPRLWFSSTNKLSCLLFTDATDPVATTDNNQVDFLSGWALVFMDYDDANILGLGRRIRLLRATAASATTLLTLGTDTAATGTFTASSDDLYLGNAAGTARSFAGLKGATATGPGLWSPAGTPLDLTVPDAIRSLVFGV